MLCMHRFCSSLLLRWLLYKGNLLGNLRVCPLLFYYSCPLLFGKSINMRVEEAIAKRCTKNSKGHKPAASHPWRKMHVGKPATDSKTVTQQHG